MPAYKYLKMNEIFKSKKFTGSKWSKLLTPVFLVIHSQKMLKIHLFSIRSSLFSFPFAVGFLGLQARFRVNFFFTDDSPRLIQPIQTEW